MNIIDLLRGAWAIEPEKLREIQGVYDTHLRGDKIDIAGIEARLGRPLASEQQEYQIREGGVAVLKLEGVMAPKANLFMRISGGVSTQMFNTQVESAIADPRVKALVLAVDSGGGSTIGTPELAQTVRELSAVKPIVTVTDGTIASAAYWVGSAANAVFGSGPTVVVGSIGVVATHSYTPNAAQTTEITAGRYKRMGSSAKPLDEEGRAYMQQMVDHIYSVFVDAVAENRGVSADDVLTHMADGRVFVGQQAVDAGLLDGFATVDQIVQRLAANPAEFAARRKARMANAAAPTPAGAQASGTPATEPVLLDNPPTATTGVSMDRQTLAAQHPELLTAILAEGAQTERERIQGVRAAGLPGHEALIERLAFDGTTTPAQAALAIVASERELRQAAASAAIDDAPAAAPASAAPADNGAATDRATQAEHAKAYAKEHNVSFVAACQALGIN